MFIQLAIPRTSKNIFNILRERVRFVNKFALVFSRGQYPQPKEFVFSKARNSGVEPPTRSLDGDLLIFFLFRKFKPALKVPIVNTVDWVITEKNGYLVHVCFMQIILQPSTYFYNRSAK